MVDLNHPNTRASTRTESNVMLSFSSMLGFLKKTYFAHPEIVDKDPSEKKKRYLFGQHEKVYR